MIWAAILFIPICAAYVLWEYNIPKNATVMDILKDFVDISPAVILLVFNRPWCAVFLMLCLVANEFIYDHWILGGLLFAAAYGSASVLATWFQSFDILLAIFALVMALGASIPIACAYNEKKSFKIGLVIYSVLAIAPLTYAFAKTANLGFICLIFGDIGLGINGNYEKKWLKVAANILYFAGTCLVPLAL